MKIFATRTDKIGFFTHEKGQSLVELAIGITFVLLPLILVIIDLGQAIFFQFSLQDAAEEGLVYGVGFPNKCVPIKERVCNNLTGSGVLENAIREEIPPEISADQVCNYLITTNFITVYIKDDSIVDNVSTPEDESMVDCELAKTHLEYGDQMYVAASFNLPLIVPFLTINTIPLTGTANGTILRPPPVE